MGREVRRVPVDFDWPLNKVWDGFLLPESLHEAPCPSCYSIDYRGKRGSGSGSTSSYRWLDAIGHLIGMLAEDVRDQNRNDGVPVSVRITGAGGVERMHPYLQELQKINVYEHRRPSADIADLTDGLMRDRRHKNVSFGFTSDFAHEFLKALKVAAGLPDNWGTCPGCDGHGSVEKYAGQRAEAEAWEHDDPPLGDGWQLWETVSEGSPISPVFKDRAGLIGWLTSPAYSWGTSQPLTVEQAEAFVDAGASVGSFVTIGGRLIQGDAAVTS